MIKGYVNEKKDKFIRKLCFKLGECYNAIQNTAFYHEHKRIEYEDEEKVNNKEEYRIKSHYHRGGENIALQIKYAQFKEIYEMINDETNKKKGK